jgi:hypothetical protein
MTNWRSELDVASSLARKAGQVIMNVYEKDFAKPMIRSRKLIN